MSLKTKAVYNNSKEQQVVLNLTFTCNFTFSPTKRSFPALLLAFTLWFLKKDESHE